MGRLESLTSLALGRGPYEDEVIETSADGIRLPGQRYSSNGRPRNAETRRRERENVRAANEVMQVTGIVEDSIAARVKAKEALQLKSHETLTGLRLMEGGRAALVAGVWGVLGLRRRILLYQPYSSLSFLEIIRQEKSMYSWKHICFSGMPAVFAYHVCDWVAFFSETVLEAILDEDDGLSTRQLQLRNVIAWMIEFAGAYATLNFRLFAILQQLNLVHSSKLFPSLGSLIPFTKSSPFARTPAIAFNYPSLLSVGTSLLHSAAPFLIMIVHGKLKYLVARTIYAPIYKSLPRPSGDSMFSGLAVIPPQSEYDTPDRENRNEGRSQDEHTLRALEGLPAVERIEPPSQPNAETPGELIREASDDEEGEIHATIISFDVEAAENAETTAGTWSAELRNTNDLKSVQGFKYRVTGLTLLPTIMATEGLREILAGLAMMPMEAFMVRWIGRSHRQTTGLAVGDMWGCMPSLESISFSNLLPAFGLQIVCNGVVWAGFTLFTHYWSTQRRTLELQAAKRREETLRNS